MMYFIFYILAVACAAITGICTGSFVAMLCPLAIFALLFLAQIGRDIEEIKERKNK